MQLPNYGKYYLYAFWDNPTGIMVRVGVTDSWPRRQREYMYGIGGTPKLNFPDYTGNIICEYKNKDEALDMEDHIISKMKPILNKNRGTSKKARQAQRKGDIKEYNRLAKQVWRKTRGRN